MSRALALPLLLATAMAGAQVNTPVNGPRHTNEPVVAFIHATVHPAPGEVLRDATVLVQGARIIDVGAHVNVSKDAVVNDLHGLHIWPGLVEPYSDLGMPAPGPRDRSEERAGDRFWNPAISASTHADLLYAPDTVRSAAYRAQGFTTVVTHRMNGIARGTSAAVELSDRSVVQDVLLPQASANFSFNKGTSNEDYPSSLMGAIALVRQSFYDAQWYAAGHADQHDAELQALNDERALPLVFEATSRNDVTRIARIGREFGLHFIVKGAGDEYARLGDIIATGQPLIVPLALPDAYDVEDPYRSLEVGIAALKQWELAPTNAERIAGAKGTFAFTTQGLKDPADLWTSLRRMVRCGLDTATAIAALTTVPAQLYRLQDRVGMLRPGMRADLVITTNHLLNPDNVVLETWAGGRRFAQRSYSDEDPKGVFDLNLRSVILKLKVTGKPGAYEADVASPGNDSLHVKAEITIQDDNVKLWFSGDRFGFKGPVRLNGTVHDRGVIWDGQGLLPGDQWTAWSAVRQSGAPKDKQRAERLAKLDSLWSAPVGNVWFPMGPYGVPLLGDTETVLFRNATVWTNGPDGVLPNTDVCISGGRIIAVGKALQPAQLFPGRRTPTVRTIDATGKHLTCGIIDEHSHIAIDRGVNEGGQAVAAEVRVGDVIDPDDIDLYRNLSGGVTAVQQLHGSADPIGGQSSLIKLRWGQGADDMPIDHADGFIKFALGENVKQSNWGGSGRFPRTRMGVEQVMYDAFHRAAAYRDAWRSYEERSRRNAPPARKGRGTTTAQPPSSDAPRRDLELDALAEVLDQKRFITCHSYVQSEILMLMDVADSMHFHVNTFTHVLEGYKVARELRAHGANASTFSDWWAYKYEVNDAIPYNAAILTEQGVNTCINSDDPEMARRLNQEAAKSVKYGGLSEQQAWKLVTLDPAKALHLDKRMGSVEAGKDADLVLWSADPLSIDAKAEMTWVDGVCRFDRNKDAELRQAMASERERLIAKMIAAKKAGAPTRKAEHRPHGVWHCETLGQEP